MIWNTELLAFSSKAETSWQFNSYKRTVFDSYIWFNILVNDEMKPLEEGRRALNWMGIHFADDHPVSGKQRFAQKSFAVAFAIVFIAFATFHVTSIMKLRLINPEKFFFVLLQFMVTVHATASFITIYLFGSHISTSFQELTDIYGKCKQIKQVPF